MYNSILAKSYHQLGSPNPHHLRLRLRRGPQNTQHIHRINLTRTNIMTTPEKVSLSKSEDSIVERSTAPSPGDGEESRKRNAYRSGNWDYSDMGTLVGVIALHFLCIFAPFTFTWAAFRLAVGLAFITGLGITLSYHRNLTHKSFKLPKWLEYLCAYCGLHALQGHPIKWVSTHRFHHQYVDTERDPHSPIEGFWFSHMAWLFDNKAAAEKCGEANNVLDLEKQPFYRFMRSSYVLHPMALGFLLYALGGYPYVVWGMGVRVVFVYHSTWLVNSACHIWGKQAWNTGDLSRNNWLVAMISFGEGWHNNHHAFEYSARHGLEWWQIDLTWYVVMLLQAVGLATHIKLPSTAHKQRLAFPPSNVD